MQMLEGRWLEVDGIRTRYFEAGAGLAQAKARFYEICRGEGIQVPVQVIWGSHDPLGTFDQGLWLYRILARRQKAAQFHVINRTGALPFREEPEAFHQVVCAFNEGLS